MEKIVVATNVTLDGKVQDPTGEEGFKRGGWFEQFMGNDRQAWATVETDEALGADALLLGRRTDKWFGSIWNERTGVWADKLNGMPKFVVSSTIQRPVWANAKVLSGDVVEEASKLKEEVHGEILVYASYQLGRVLIEHDLVDELRLFVFPVVLGAGESLFDETSDKKAMRLTGAKTVGEGLAYLTYEFVRDEARVG